VRKAVIIFGLFLSVVFTGVNPAFGADKYALLIGINDYSRSAGFSDLAGPLNDIRLMKETLESDRFGFEHVTVLLNAEATHSRIEKAFKGLARRINKKKAGVVYIYYSGHGSRTLDLNGDEMQIKDLHGHILPSYDQTWVTFGSRLKKDASPPQGFLPVDHFDILDDEISEWLGEIAAGCDQVVFVSDSCHSGSVSRGGIGSGVRRGTADTREHPLGRKKYAPVVEKNVVRIGASQDAQLAREFLPAGSAERYGFFTWYWVKALSKCLPGESWSHLFNRVSQIVQQETPNRQIPQISGAVTMEVFGSEFLEPSRTISVYQVLERAGVRQVYLAAGRLSGVTEGSVYTLDDQVGRSDAPEIKIVQALATHSVGVTRADVKTYDQVIEISHQYAVAPMRLLLKAEHEKDRGPDLEAVRKVINKLAPYKVTEDAPACDLMIYLFHPGRSLSALGHPKPDAPGKVAPPPSNEAAKAQIWVLDRNGFLYQDNLRHSCTPEGLASLERNLLRLARMKDMLQIVSPARPSPLQITVTPMVPASHPPEKAEAGYVRNPWPTKTCDAPSYKVSEAMPLNEFLNEDWSLCTMLRFGVRNPTMDVYYFYVVYIRNDAEIVPVFPSLADSSQIAAVEPGCQNSVGSASVRLDTRTLDHFKLIMCRKPINHHLFYQSGMQLTLRGKAKVANLNPLEKIIMNAATGTRSAVAYKTGSWYAETITVDMR
jgi:hypothetical protein